LKNISKSTEDRDKVIAINVYYR